MPVRIRRTTVSYFSSELGLPSFSTRRTGMLRPAQWTSVRKMARASAASSAAFICPVSLTSVATNCTAVPSSRAISAPFDDGKSAITTNAPRSTPRITIASPSPEAPPVTTIEVPAIFILAHLQNRSISKVRSSKSTGSALRMARTHR